AGHAGGGRRVRDGPQTLWRDRGRRRDARLSPRDLLRRGHARADALGGDRAVGRALSRAAGRDDHLRLRPAQLLRPVQRRGGSPLSPAGDPGALRDGRVTAHRRSAIESTVLTTSAQTSTVTAGWRPGNPARTRLSPPRTSVAMAAARTSAASAARRAPPPVMRNANGSASRTRAAVNAFAIVQTVARMTSDHSANGLDMTLDTRYRPLERRAPRESPRASAPGRARRLRT